MSREEGMSGRVIVTGSSTRTSTERAMGTGFYDFYLAAVIVGLIVGFLQGLFGRE